MIDVFFCSTGDRPDITNQCLQAWDSNSLANVRVITPSMLYTSKHSFQKQRRIFADHFAISNPYILTDDDCLPSENLVARGVELLFYYPDFAILSPLHSNETIYPWTPEDYTAVLDEKVMEHVSVGGIRFCRQGVLKEWPEQTAAHYDAAHCEAIRKVGMRVGLMRQVTAIHLGKGKTTIEN